MKLYEITNVTSVCPHHHYRGKYKNYVCHIVYSEYYNRWYYCIFNRKMSSYSSLLAGNLYASKDGCMAACTRYIDTQIKGCL